MTLVLLAWVGHSYVSGCLCKAIVAQVHKFKKVIFGFVVADTKKGSKCPLFIITSVPESLQQDAKFLEPRYSFSQQIILSFEMQVSQSSSISKQWKWNQLCKAISPFVMKKLSTILQFVDQMLVKSWMFSTIERLQPYFSGMSTYCHVELMLSIRGLVSGI